METTVEELLNLIGTKELSIFKLQAQARSFLAKNAELANDFEKLLEKHKELLRLILRIKMGEINPENVNVSVGPGSAEWSLDEEPVCNGEIK